MERVYKNNRNYYKKTCQFCNKEYLSQKIDGKTCSRKCAGSILHRDGKIDLTSFIEANKKWHSDNPDKSKELSIKNLPKNNEGDKNGNWQGGKTKESKDFRVQNSWKFKNWRKSVLERDDHKCKECGSTTRLEAHHIISLKECKLTAFLVMNGVTLCRECHKVTDSYCGKNKINPISGNVSGIYRTIPHKYHEYPTVGNYNWTEDGLLVIFVSDMNNEDYEYLVMMHEQIEAHLCKKRGILEKDISDFDIQFEKDRALGLHSPDEEPGDSFLAPYNREHVFASKIERMLANELGVDWKEYEKTITDL
jgi:hypothetical protein